MGDEFNTVDWGGLLIAADALVVIDVWQISQYFPHAGQASLLGLVPGIPCSELPQSEQLFLFLLNLWFFLCSDKRAMVDGLLKLAWSRMALSNASACLTISPNSFKTSAFASRSVCRISLFMPVIN